MNKTLLKTTNNKNYNFKKDLSLHLKHHMRPSSKILRENTVFGRFYFQFVQMLEVLKCREDHHS